jgi:hypothetical protein
MQYLAMDTFAIAAILKNGGLLADLKGIWRNLELQGQFTRWEL